MNTPLHSYSQTTLRYLIVVSALIFIAGHLVGGMLFGNNWSFIHWSYISLWYLIGWVLISSILFYFLGKDDTLQSLAKSKPAHIIITGALLLIFILFGFDSFLYGGGNYRMSQIAQADSIIYRWYEPLSILVVGIFDKFFGLFIDHAETAGFYAWKLFTYISVYFTLLFSWKLAKFFTADVLRQVYLFLVLFFSPSALLYFGYVGLEPVIPALVYTFSWLGLRNIKRFTLRKLFLLWVLFFAAIFFHVSMVILLPAVIFLTFRPLFSRAKSAAFLLGALVMIALVVVTYLATGIDYEVANHILQLNGPDYSNSYHLFTLNHIGDVIQLVLLALPLIIVLKALSWKNLSLLLKDGYLQLILLITMGANIIIVILDPVHSIVLDYPRFIAYLSPAGLLLGYYFSKAEISSLKNLKLTAYIMVIIPFATLPVYTSIYTAEEYVDSYLNKNKHYYFEGTTALQNAYFYLGDKERADDWFVALPKNSPDFYDYQAATELTAAEIYSEAVSKLNNLKAKYPFWVEPRQLLSTIHLNRRHYQFAKQEIDSCLLINPYNYQSRTLLYRFYRDINDFDNALATINQSIQIFPKHLNLREDKLIAHYRHGDMRVADSLAIALIKVDSSLAFPYLIRGFIAEYTHDTSRAISLYGEFIRLAPDEPETPDIRKRQNDLINAFNDK